MNQHIILGGYRHLSVIFIVLMACTTRNPGSTGETQEPIGVDLFDGRSLSGWHVDVPEMDSNASAVNPFIIRDGLLVSLGTPQGHVITDKTYSNYILDIEYRFAGTPGNCGALVHASTPRALYKMFPKSIEVQMMHENAGDFWCIVEDIVVPDMEKRRGLKENWGITEGKERRVQNLTEGSEKPLGDWNVMRIVCWGDSIQVTLNNDLVNFGYDCTAKSGQIALQAEGSEVEFRKVHLTPISEWPALPQGSKPTH
ncbi:3-keto-disaccharide hydrolase [Chryseolinea sp. T2]|uniref:3-keto-disaccharide hydrolase n=1 Tax=Chryseolinea sp. T2 TaxID=3129255 RepID=UPI003FCCDD54